MADEGSVLKLATSTLPILTVVVGGLWGFYTYTEERRDERTAREEAAKREADTRLFEAQRPFLTKQFDLYMETARVIGVLVTSDVETSEWLAAKKRFLALYWSELSMVESREVEAAMIEFERRLGAYEETRSPAAKRALDHAAYGVAHAIRNSLQKAWTVQ